MDTKIMVRWIYAAVVSAVMLASGACSKVESSLLDSVPSSAQVVAVADVELLLKRSGCQVADGAVTLSPELQKIVDTPAETSTAVSSTLRMLVDLYGAIDMSEVVYVSLDPNQDSNGTFLTFMISDEGAVTDKMKEKGVQNTGSDGIEVYAGADWTLAMHDGQGWLIPAGMDSDKARSYFTAPDRKESIGSQSGIVDFLNADNAVNVAVLADGLSGNIKTEGRRACFGVKVEDSVIGMHMQLIAPDGEITRFASDYKEIDTDFLNYVPGSYIAAAAFGFTSDFDWSSLATAAALLGSRDVASAVQMAIPFLSRIDGTVAVAAGPAGGAPAIADINLKTWNFTVMAHMAQSDVDATLAQLGALAPHIGASPVKMESDDSGMDAWMLPDGTVIYAGNVDGCLAVSNLGFKPVGDNSMTDIFLSQRAAMAVNIPAGSEVVKAFGMPWGFNCSMQVGESDLNVRFSLNGSSQSVLQALLAQMMK